TETRRRNLGQWLRQPRRVSDFGFRASFGPRTSDFGIWSRFLRRFCFGLVIAAAVVCTLAPVSTAAPLQVAGMPVELTLAEISKNTLRLQLLPLDEQGRPRQAPLSWGRGVGGEGEPSAPSTILVPFATAEKLRLRELPRPQQL